MTAIPFHLLVTPAQAQGDLAKLVQSIKLDGLIEPLKVTPAGRCYHILEGKRRYHAIASLIEKNVLVWDREAEEERPARDVFNTVPCDVVE